MIEIRGFGVSFGCACSPRKSIPNKRMSVWVRKYLMQIFCFCFSNVLLIMRMFLYQNFSFPSAQAFLIELKFLLLFYGRINTSQVVPRKNPSLFLYPSWCILCKGTLRRYITFFFTAVWQRNHGLVQFWNCVVMTVWWVLWIERSGRIFEERKKGLTNCLKMLHHGKWLWLRK